MKTFKEFFDSRRSCFEIETKHAIRFLRPVPDFASGGRPCPTPGMAEALRFGQIGFAFAPGRLHQLPLDGDAREMSNVFDRILFTRIWATWLPIVHGKGPDHFAFG